MRLQQSNDFKYNVLAAIIISFYIFNFLIFFHHLLCFLTHVVELISDMKCNKKCSSCYLFFFIVIIFYIIVVINSNYILRPQSTPAIITAVF